MTEHKHEWHLLRDEIFTEMGHPARAICTDPLCDATLTAEEVELRLRGMEVLLRDIMNLLDGAEERKAEIVKLRRENERLKDDLLASRRAYAQVIRAEEES